MTSTPKSKSNGDIPNRTSTLYTETKWPVITRSTQDALLQLLIEYVFLLPYHTEPLLASTILPLLTTIRDPSPYAFVIAPARTNIPSLLVPIGQYKRDHVTLSKGKRSKKRKRASAKDETTSTANEKDLKKPPRPLIEKHITIGLSSTTRHLEDLQNQTDAEPEGKCKSKRHQRLSVIFFTHATNYLPYRHFPAIVATIARLDVSKPPILLVALANGSESKLSAALGIPRVGLVGICDDTPNGTALLGYARENVPLVGDPWLQDNVKG